MQKKTSLAKFLIPSTVGLFLFMFPIHDGEKWSVLVKIISDWISGAIGYFLPLLCLIIVTVSAVLGILFLGKPNAVATYPVVADIFSVTKVWVVIRLIGAVFLWLTFFEVGGIFSAITSADNGGFVLNDLLSVLVVIFLLAGFFLPLLIDFGLLEFVGTLCTKIMRPLFNLPGRAAIDCLTSWVVDGTIGVVFTATQYERGYYSKRESAIIATTFSTAGIAFSIVVLAQVDLMEYFGWYYLLICAVGFVCAIIIPRIPPLSLKRDEYFVEGKAVAEGLPAGYTSTFDYGIDLAKKTAAQVKSFQQYLSSGMKLAAGMWFGVLPVVMCIGTLALLAVNETTIFDTLGLPFLPLLNLLDVPQPVEVSKTLLVGFTDMVTPSIIAAKTITVPMSKFIVAIISITQLIFLSEVGGLILGSKIPVNLPELFIIFLERTIISLLIVVPAAHFIFAS